MTGAHMTTVSYGSAQSLMRTYSTSFWLAACTLPPAMRRRIASIYALVRVADEIVDSTSATEPAVRHRELDRLENAVDDAVSTGLSSDITVHAFAQTARSCGITSELWHPFFESMRADISPVRHTQGSLDGYIYGSAEVVGLMCVRVFFAGPPRPAHRADDILEGARALGNAFQRINFLRDVAHDSADLGRGYLALDDSGQLSEESKNDEIAQIRTRLRTAAPAIELLPSRVRPAVRTAALLFSRLTDIAERTPAHAIMSTRLRVPDGTKALLAARSMTGGPLRVRATPDHPLGSLR